MIYTTIAHVAKDAGEKYYIAYHPDLPGCTSDGDSLAGAIENLADARDMVLCYLRENNLPIPKPWDLAKGITVDFEKLEAHQHA